MHAHAQQTDWDYPTFNRRGRNYEITCKRYEIICTRYEIICARYEIMCTRYESVCKRYEDNCKRYEITWQTLYFKRNNTTLGIFFVVNLCDISS